MISEHTILGTFVSAPGWAVYPGGSLTNGWHARYTGGQLSDYEVYLDVSEEWVYLQCPLLRADARPECKSTLYGYLLRCNSRMFFAKFTLLRVSGKSAPADWIALTAECPVDGFIASTFRVMLEAIETYASEYDRELQVIAFDKRAADLLDSGYWSSE